MSITPETWDRIASAVRTVEGQAVNESSRPVSYSRTTAPQVCRVQVTGALQGQFYPCTFQQRDPNAGTWSPLGTGWAEGFNGEVLVNQRYYPGLLEGVNSADSVPIVMVFTLGLSVKDLWTGAQLDGISRIILDSTGSTISDDWALGGSGGDATVKHNGLTAVVSYCDLDGTIHKLYFEHGLLKSRV